MSVLFRDADNYMAVIFREWLENFPMPHYMSSDDPDEREYIAGVVKKVGFNTNTNAEGPANRRQGMRNYLRWILWSKEKVYQDWQDDIRRHGE